MPWLLRSLTDSLIHFYDGGSQRHFLRSCVYVGPAAQAACQELCPPQELEVQAGRAGYRGEDGAGGGKGRGMSAGRWDGGRWRGRHRAGPGNAFNHHVQLLLLCVQGWKIGPFGAWPLAHAPSRVNMLLALFVLVCSKFLKITPWRPGGLYPCGAPWASAHLLSHLRQGLGPLWVSVSLSKKQKELHVPFQV